MFSPQSALGMGVPWGRNWVPTGPRCQRWGGICGETRSLPSACAGVGPSRVTLRESERSQHFGV